MQLSQIVWTVGGSGGASNCISPTGNTVGSCSGGYPKPSWQSGRGVPNDHTRDIPDVSLFASNGFMGNFYVICQSDMSASGTCNTSSDFYFSGFGGTSVSSPAFAAIMALVNQQTGERQGNANYVFYKLAAQQPTAFHDVTSGTIAMPCATGSTNCSTTTAGDAYGILTGYSAGPGYDLATGLGSVDADKLVTLWTSASQALSTTTITNLTPNTLTHGQAVNFSITVKPQSGSGPAPTGLVSLEGGPTNATQGVTSINLSNGTTSGTTNLLPGGTYSVIARYAGDSTYAASDSAPVGVTVNKESSQTQAFLVTLDFNGKIVNGNATSAIYGSPYLLRMNVENSAGHLCVPVSAAAATGCPSGQITLTDNGNLLDAGTFALNSYGYVEDQTVQLTGGTNSITAQYSGDNSFTASSASPNITIAPAATTDQSPVVNSGSSIVGSVAGFASTVQATSLGQPPTGSMTFYSNGVPIAGVPVFTPLQSGNQSNNFTASSLGSIWPPTSLFAAPGTYHITSAYSGDKNYQPSISPVAAIVVAFPPPGISVQASASSIAAGSNVTLTTIISGASKTIAPTGTISFSGYEGPIQGAVSYSTVTDSITGNLDLQGSITFVPLFSDFYSALYASDPNYPSVQTNGFIVSLTVTGTDFSLITSPQRNFLLVQPGLSGSIELVAGLQSATTPISFGTNACAGLPAEATCTFSPNPVSSTGGFTVTVATTSPHSAAVRGNKLLGIIVWTATLGRLAVILLVTPCRRRRRLDIAMCLMVGFLFISLGCGGSGGNGVGTGGGGSGGGFTDPGTPAGNYVITVTGSSGTVSHTTTFTLVVQ